MKTRLLIIGLLLLKYMGASSQSFPAKTIFQATGTTNTPCKLHEGKTPDDNRETYTKVELDESLRGAVSPAVMLQPWLKNIKKHFAANLPEALRRMPTEVYTLRANEVRLVQQKNEYILTGPGGKELLRSPFLCMPYKPDIDNGVNVYNGDKSIYFTKHGRLLVNGRYDFVDDWGDHFYRVTDSGKHGLADSNGTTILEPDYDDVYGFNFNGNTWFWLQRGTQSWYQQKGSDEKIVIPQDEKNPTTLHNRYWESWGRIYDMQTRQRLFCGISKSIYVYDRKAGILRISDWKADFDLLFNINGSMVFEYPCKFDYKTSDSPLKVVALYTGRDTTINGKKIILPKYGVVDEHYKWVIQPEYDRLEAAGPGYFSGRKKFTDKAASLLDSTGKPVPLPQRFWRISAGPSAGRLLCSDTGGAYLYQVAANRVTKLPEHYFSIEQQKTPGHYLAGVYRKPARYIMWRFADSNFNILRPELMGYTSYYEWQEAYVCKLADSTGDGDDIGHDFYLDNQLRKIQVTHNGRTYETFRGMSRLGGGYTYYNTTTGDRFLQGQHTLLKLPDTLEIAQYDTTTRWLITYHRGLRGLMDTEGRELLPAVCNNIEFNGRVLVLALPSGTQTMNLKGELLFKGRYQVVKPLLGDCYIVGLNGRLGVAHEDGRIIIPVEYEYVKFELGRVWYGNSKYTAVSMPVSAFR